MPGSKLQQQLGKRHPFTSPEQEAILNLLRTSDQFENRIGRLLREYGLTSSQYNVLRILRGEGKPLPSQEIARRTIQVVPAMTGLIDRLEKQRFVTRERCTEDRRVVFIQLTEQGRKVLSQLDEPMEQLHRELIGHVSADRLKLLIEVLEEARASVAD
ncbi:MAG: MarR family transcriptional regulator [Planctomycetaceae bacterium]|nr:MarR family transcriptional regulator [Planctomycetaceae bacterium]